MFDIEVQPQLDAVLASGAGGVLGEAVLLAGGDGDRDLDHGTVGGEGAHDLVAQASRPVDRDVAGHGGGGRDAARAARRDGRLGGERSGLGDAGGGGRDDRPTLGRSGGLGAL